MPIFLCSNFWKTQWSGKKVANQFSAQVIKMTNSKLNENLGKHRIKDNDKDWVRSTLPTPLTWDTLLLAKVT